MRLLGYDSSTQEDKSRENDFQAFFFFYGTEDACILDLASSDVIEDKLGQQLLCWANGSETAWTRFYSKLLALQVALTEKSSLFEWSEKDRPRTPYWPAQPEVGIRIGGARTNSFFNCLPGVRRDYRKSSIFYKKRSSNPFEHRPFRAVKRLGNKACSFERAFFAHSDSEESLSAALFPRK